MIKLRGHICIRRKAKDGADGTPGAAGKSIRTTVWESGKQYYAGDTQVDGVFPLDIVSDKAMAIGTSGVNFYMCIKSHQSLSSIPLTNTSYWQKLNSLKPVVTYLILAEAIKANLIDVENLAADTTFINNLIAKKLRVVNGNTVLLYAGDTTYPLMCGSDNPNTAVTKIDAAGNIYANGGKFGLLHIDSNGISIESDDSQDDYQYGHLGLTGISFADDDLEYRSSFGVAGMELYEGSGAAIASYDRYGPRVEPRHISAGNTANLGRESVQILYYCSGNTAYLTLPSQPGDGQSIKLINIAHAQYIILRCLTSIDIKAAESGKTQQTSGSYHTMEYSGTPAVVNMLFDGVDWITYQ